MILDLPCQITTPIKAFMQKKSTPIVSNNYQLFESLKSLDRQAIRHMSNRLLVAIKALPGIYHFQKEDIEELRNDALLITLKKITSEEFVFQDYDPLSYAMGVARKLFANMIRKRKLNTIPLQEFDKASDINPEKYYLQKEAETVLGKLLKTVGENCEKIIRLKYYDNMKDQEVIDKKMSIYSTVNSLKNKRSQCLKKLSELVKEKGFSFSALFTS